MAWMVNVSAVIVTRGDVDLSPVLDSLPRDWGRVVWDNGAREVRWHLPGAFRATFAGNDHTGPLQDLAVYGRYVSIAYARDADLIYVQDDDCVLAPESFDALLAAYEPGHVVCNQPQRFRDTGFYDDHALVGFGALFDRELPDRAFARFVDGHGVTRPWPWPHERLPLLAVTAAFHRTCDIVFTALTPRTLVDVPYTDLPWAHAPNRMWKTEGHVAERTRMLELVRQVRDGAAA